MPQTSPQPINARGGFPADRQSFMMVAKCNNTLISGDTDSPSGGEMYFLLTRISYRADGHVNDTTELVFTPFFAGDYAQGQTANDTNSDYFEFLRMAQLGTGSQCNVLDVAPNESDDNHPHFPFYPYNGTKDDGGVYTLDPFSIYSTQPAVMYLTPSGNSYELFCYDLEVGSAQQMWQFNGDKTQVSPFTSAVYVKGDIDPNAVLFDFQAQSIAENHNLVQNNTLYSGYPYRITSQNKGAGDTFPFRNFLPQVCVTTNKPVNFKNYVNYISYKFSDNQTFSIIQFPGPYWTSINGNIGLYSPDKGPGKGNYWNFQNKTFTGSNLQDTTQIYLVPTSFFTSGGGGDCFVNGSTALDPTAALDNFLKQYFGGNTPVDCTSNFTQSFCLYADGGTCATGVWYDYCLNNGMYCGDCFGACPTTTVQLDSFCRLRDKATPPTIFVCGNSPNPEPTPTPNPQENFFKKYEKDFIILATILLIVFTIILVLFLTVK